MKIIFITREGYNLSGARVRCYNFARELKKLGLETEVFSFGDNLGAKYGEEEFEMSLADKIKLNFKAIRRLAVKCKDTVFFIQRLNYHSLAPFVLSLSRKNKIIFDCDDWNIRENPVYYLGLYPSSKMEFLTRKFARYAHTCIVASAFLKEYLGSFARKIYYIPTGVDTDFFKSGTDTDGSPQIRLSWIGTAYHREMYENIKFLLDCFSVLAKEYDCIFLHLAGMGSYFKDIRLETGRLSCAERIIIDGWIPPDRIPGYLQRLDIGLLPLIQDTKFNKAKSPTKLFEYMAMAKPTVSSNIGEAAHIIQEGNTGFLAEDKQDFISKLRILIENPSLRKEMGSKAREAVEARYSLRVLGKQLYEIVTQTMGQQ